VISTRKILVFTRRVRFPHAEYDFHTQSGILQAECAFYTHESKREYFDTDECDYDSLECDLHTQSVIYTRKVWFTHAKCDLHTQSVIHGECNFNKQNIGFYTQSTIFTRSVLSTHTRVILTLTSVITTRSSVIYTRTV
jgi:hypothetical protein